MMVSSTRGPLFSIYICTVLGLLVLLSQSTFGKTKFEEFAEKLSIFAASNGSSVEEALTLIIEFEESEKLQVKAVENPLLPQLIADTVYRKGDYIESKMLEDRL